MATIKSTGPQSDRSKDKKTMSVAWIKTALNKLDKENGKDVIKSFVAEKIR